MIKNMQYAVYKGMGGKHGALQFSFQPPHYYKGKDKDFYGDNCFSNDGKLLEGWKVREGCVFLEISSAIDKNVYDWENKITVALSTNDLGKLVFGLKTGEEVKLMHDPGAKSDAAGLVRKNVNVSMPNGTMAGCMFRVSETRGDVTKTHMVPLSGDELVVLVTLFSEAIVKSLGW